MSMRAAALRGVAISSSIWGLLRLWLATTKTQIIYNFTRLIQKQKAGFFKQHDL
jgi:hypothetical protein